MGLSLKGAEVIQVRMPLLAGKVPSELHTPPPVNEAFPVIADP